MTAYEKSVHVIDLFRLRSQSPDGQITYAAWPEAGAALIVQAVARVAAIEPRKLLLYGGLAGLVVLFFVVSGDRHANRRRRR